MHIIAYDAGATTGCALLEYQPRSSAPPAIRSVAVLRTSTVAQLSDFWSIGGPPHAMIPNVVIEAPAQIYGPKHSAPLLWAARVGGFIEGAYQTSAATISLTHCTAADVRKVLCGKRNANDQDVAAALAGLKLEGMPKRCNSHVRDAIAAGYVWWLTRGRRA